ncbi:MAG: replicative DNA helicase, partial [Clostridia bacterium]|nr:replicative DNA helicase [Clostridia bacterium]
EIITAASEESDDARTIMDAAEQKIFDIRQDKESEGLKPIKEVILETYERLHNLTGEEKEKHQGIRTGFSDLDRLTAGLNKSDLIVLAARPAMGKTSMALNIVHNAALRGHRVAVFSLEMTREQLASRVLSDESNIDNRKLRSGELLPDDWVRLAQAADTLSRCGIYIDDTPGITAAEIKARCRRVRDLELVVIDYLQLMSTGTRIENRVQEISQITRNLKIMAKSLDVPVLVLSQLSRGVEQRTDHTPQLSDLRESGSIEQDAVIVMFLSRDTDSPQQEEAINNVICSVAKNRHGATDRIQLLWDGDHTRFSSVERYRDER